MSDAYLVLKEGSKILIDNLIFVRLSNTSQSLKFFLSEVNVPVIK